jgi:hypothetical protein
VVIDPVLIQFAAGGVAEVGRAFDTIERRMARFESDAVRATESGSTARTRIARNEATARERELAKIAKATEREEQKATREVERLEAYKQRVRQKSSEMAGRIAEQEVEAEKKAADKIAREVDRLEQYKMRVRQRSAEMAGRAAEQAASAEIAAHKRALSTYAGAAGRGLSQGLGAVKMVAGAAMIGGGFVLADAAREQFSSQRTAGLLVNAGTNGGVAPGTVGDALSAASKASSITGMSKADLLKSALTYSQNARGGDFKGALANMSFFGKLSKVTGTDINDIAEAAGTLQSQNASLRDNPKAMQQMLLNAVAQSHQGSMSLVDAAKQIGTLGSTRSSFSQDESKSQMSLIGLGQIARVGGDVGEAGTFVKDLALEAGAANKKWREMHGGKKFHGPDLIQTNAHGQMTSPEQMIADIFRGTGGNISTINELMGKRGGAVFRELEKSYLTGEKKGGVEGGIKSVLGNIKEVSGATMTPEELDKQHAQVMSTSAERVDAAMVHLKETLGDKLEPVLVKFAATIEKAAPDIAKLLDGFVKVADIFLDHPWAGLGAIVGGFIVKELAAAGIGMAIKNAIAGGIATSLASGGGVTAGAVKGAGGLAGQVAGIGTVAVLGSAMTTGMAEVSQGLTEGTAAGKASAQGTIADIKAGKVSAADVKAKMDEAQKTVDETSGIKSVGKGVLAATGIDPLAQAFGLVDKGKSVAGGDDAGTIAKKQAAALEITKNADGFKRALDSMAAAMRIGAQDVSRNHPISDRPVK